MLTPLLVLWMATAGPVAQDAEHLYVGLNGEVVRIVKATGKRTRIGAPVGRRISAVDLAGETVFYGTATTRNCPVTAPLPPLPCTSDGEQNAVYAARGSSVETIVSGATSIAAIAHDDEHVYWLEERSLRRRGLQGGPIEMVVDGLRGGEGNLTADERSIFFSSDDRGVVRIDRRSGAMTSFERSSAFSFDAEHVYTRTLRISRRDFRTAVYAVEGLVAGTPARGVWTTADVSRHEVIIGLVFTDACGANRRIGQRILDRSGSITPVPAIAIDETGVWTNGERVMTFAPARLRIDAIDPPAIRVNGGIITISGEGFGAAPTVEVGRRVANVLSANDREIRVAVPPRAQPWVERIAVRAGGDCAAATLDFVDSRPVRR